MASTVEIVVVSSESTSHAVDEEEVDALGAASGEAQGLRSALTTLAGVRHCKTPQRLYLSRCEGRLVGLLKVGAKHLFYWRADGATRELDPLCVLDFFVAAERRRGGVGKALFDAMLAREAARPAALAYDRPSPKLLPFLAKHYGLRAFAPQPNNFVIFDDFFDDEDGSSGAVR